MTLLRLLPLLALFACDSDSNGDSLTIIGSYTDDFGGTHVITEDSWTQGGFGAESVFHLTQYDNVSLFAIAENDAANEYNASLWSRFDWTTDADDKLWICQSSFDAADEAAALAATPADDMDLAAGCGGFGWSGLTAAR